MIKLKDILLNVNGAAEIVDDQIPDLEDELPTRITNEYRF